jgi:hypothetical protein
MRSRLLPFSLLLAALVGGFALASAAGLPASPTGEQRVAAYAPLVVQDSARAQPAATDDPAVTATPTTTATQVTATAPTPATPTNCDPEADLSGVLIADGQGRIVNASAACSYDVGLASYRALDSHIHNKELFDSATATILPGQTLDLTVAVPDCAAQIDLFYGALLLSLDGQRYGERLLDSRFVFASGFCPPGTPAPTGTSTPTSTPGPTTTATPSPSPT